MYNKEQDEIDTILDDLNGILESKNEDVAIATTSTNQLANLTTTIASSNGKYSSSCGNSFDDSKYFELKMLEFQQLNGNSILLKLQKNCINEIQEKTHRKIQFTRKFPFLKIDEFKYIEFNHLNNRYQIKSSLTAFLDALDIDYTSFAEISLKDALKNG